MPRRCPSGDGAVSAPRPTAAVGLVLPLLFVWIPVAFLATVACAESRMVGGETSDDVVIVVPVDAPLFAESASLRVRLWNASQLAAMDGNARCAVVHDPQTNTDERHCPEGTTFQPVTPEQLELPLPAGDAPLAVTSASVRPGERFRILLSGPSRDGCNTTSADVVATASTGERTFLKAPTWQTTARACL